ncbi:MAG TPA: aminotransferase class III-fold pyridoxal phosphate-dependent enzyme [Solirubrobacteraceae bacterium]|jgi:ornithine--oxo-acid transaminase|nr:aminotransferase class III-fold pyridoxal phosphate-dependent enzyme [Solirubrobacteraceae bacterium]
MPIASVKELLASHSGEAMALNDRYMNPQLGRIVRTLGFDRTWVRGEGAHLIDAEGESYLDLICGYGTFAVGRNHPDVIAALGDLMMARSPNLPQLGVSVLPGALAEALVERAPSRIAAMVPANTGTEAVEGAIKLARAATGRQRILYATHAFHGLTLGSLSLNGDDNFRDGFGPLLPGCDSVEFGDAAALRGELERRDVAAFIVEPIQGKGVNLPPDGYLQDAQAACRETETLFVCDEVQTGIGRTGRLFALEHWGLDPDMICVAKALSGGFVPVGGVLVSEAVRERVFDGMERGVRHGSTFGGNDMAAAAGLATLAVIEREGLIERAASLGALLLELTQPLVERYEIVRDVRGMGLMWAIELGAPDTKRRRVVWSLVERAQSGLAAQLLVVPLFKRHRIFCQVAGHRMNVVKALPALVVEESEIRRFAAALEDVVERADRMGGAVGRLGLDLARGGARALRRSASKPAAHA